MGKYDGDPLVQRWAGFIEKIMGRLEEIKSESAAGFAGLVQQAPDDYMSFNNALSGLDHRVDQLRTKIDNTWDEQVEEKFSDAEDSKSGILDAGLDLKTDAENALEQRWWTFKAEQAIKFYENLAPMAHAKLAQPPHCTQCGTPMQNPQPMEMQSITCPSCQAVNQVAPDPLVTAYAGAPAAYADAAALPIRIEIDNWKEQVDRQQRAKRMRDDYSNEGIEYYEKWEQLERKYWTTYAQTLAEKSGKPVDNDLINARLKQFYVYTLEMEQDWVRKYGKRSQQM